MAKEIYSTLQRAGFILKSPPPADMDMIQPLDSIKKVGEIDITKGAFWQSDIGHAVSEILKNPPVAELKESLSSARIAIALELLGGRSSHADISYLVRKGLLMQVGKTHNHYLFTAEHLVLTGLYLTHLEAGYSAKESAQIVGSLIVGSNLESYFDHLTSTTSPIARSRRIFLNGSPWRKLPITKPSTESETNHQNLPPSNQPPSELMKKIGTPRFSYEEIIKMDSSLLEQAENWTEETLLQARRAIPRNVEPAIFDDSTFPPDIARLIIWITEVYERTFKDTRRVLDDTTSIEMSNMAGLVIASLRRNPKIRHLRQLIEAMKRKLEADISAAQEQKQGN